MTRRLDILQETWAYARPFGISRGVKTEANVVVVQVTDGDAVGRGECVPYARYDESVGSVTQQIEDLRDKIVGGLNATELQAALGAGAARNAIDCALWDLDAKRAGRRAWDLAGLAEPSPVVTAETIGIGSPEDMHDRAKALSAAPLLKVKLDQHEVDARLKAVRSGAPGARIVIDPNEGWNRALLIEFTPLLEDIGVEMIEQPVPAAEDEQLRGLDMPIPLCADESGHTSLDLERLKGLYGMVNIKLDKTGGLTEALELADKAEALGFELMIGCMVATSLAMAPACLIAGRCRVVDLDGPLILKHDRQPGLTFKNGFIHPPEPDLWG